MDIFLGLRSCCDGSWMVLLTSMHSTPCAQQQQQQQQDSNTAQP
jgi:hypothetical protein